MTKNNQLNPKIVADMLSNPENEKAIYTIARFIIEQGVRNEKEFTEKMIEDVGEWIKDEIPRIWKEFNTTIKLRKDSELHTMGFGFGKKKPKPEVKTEPMTYGEFMVKNMDNMKASEMRGEYSKYINSIGKETPTTKTEGENKTPNKIAKDNPTMINYIKNKVNRIYNKIKEEKKLRINIVNVIFLITATVLVFCTIYLITQNENLKEKIETQNKEYSKINERIKNIENVIGINEKGEFERKGIRRIRKPVDLETRISDLEYEINSIESTVQELEEYSHYHYK